MTEEWPYSHQHVSWSLRPPVGLLRGQGANTASSDWPQDKPCESRRLIRVEEMAQCKPQGPEFCPQEPCLKARGRAREMAQWVRAPHCYYRRQKFGSEHPCQMSHNCLLVQLWEDLPPLASASCGHLHSCVPIHRDTSYNIHISKKAK
jgi:hypothetical protein